MCSYVAISFIIRIAFSKVITNAAIKRFYNIYGLYYNDFGGKKDRQQKLVSFFRYRYKIKRVTFWKWPYVLVKEKPKKIEKVVTSSNLQLLFLRNADHHMFYKYKGSINRDVRKYPSAHILEHGNTSSEQVYT
jgi:hypothetical protein